MLDCNVLLAHYFIHLSAILCKSLGVMHPQK